MTAGVVIVAVISFGVFLLAFRWAGILPVLHKVLEVGKGAMAVIIDPALDDDIKEKTIQRVCGRMAKLAFSSVARLLAVLAAPMIIVFAADRAGLASMSEVIRFVSRWDVLLVSLIIAIAAFRLVR